MTRRPWASALALALALSVGACSDGVAPALDDGISVALSVQVPAAVSQAETEVLADAFDRIDSYEVIVADSINGATIFRGTVPFAGAGTDQHSLGVTLPPSTEGLVVLVTLIGREGGVELYRTSGYMRVQFTANPIPVPLSLRYTGPGLRGIVRDPTGTGIAGVSVELLQGANLVASVPTEPDGTYLFLPANEGGVLNPGPYRVRPVPPDEFVCPDSRDVTVTDGAALVANFTATGTACQIDLLVISGGDLQFEGDTETVAALFANTPSVTTQTFFFVNQLPGLGFLEQFDVVLLFANGQFDESRALGDQIESYVQAGGNLVVGSFYWQNRSDSNLDAAGWGRLENIDPFRSQVDPFSGVGGATYKAASLDVESIVTGDTATGDALVQGLSSLTSSGFRGGVAAASGATVVASWSDGTPLIGYRILGSGQRLVAISLFPASGPAASGDVQLLWENAVLWTGLAGGP